MRGPVAWLIRRELRRTFRRIVWIGPPPELPERPVVVVANHQSFHDGYLLWLLALELLGRRFLVWMEEVDRVPFFALQGALPFPPADPRRRASSVRRTRRLLAATPRTVLGYFPEGVLHGADEPIQPFAPEHLTRLHRVLGEPTWWTVAIHLTWRGDSRPTALLTGGAVTPAPTGDERNQLQELRAVLRHTAERGAVLLDGRARRHEQLDLHWARGLFHHRPGDK